MKKKFGLWFNIVTICLCVCAIAIGVYSATTANLNVAGKIGFTAHGCNVNVGVFVTGHAVDQNGANNADGYPSQRVQIADNVLDTNDTDANNLVEILGAPKTVTLGTMFFSDMNSADGTPEDIVVELEFTNASKFKVVASADQENCTTGSSAVKVTYTQGVVMDEINGTTTTGKITFTLSLQKTGNTYAGITEANAVSFNLAVKFDKTTEFDSTSTKQDTNFGIKHFTTPEVNAIKADLGEASCCDGIPAYGDANGNTTLQYYAERFPYYIEMGKFEDGTSIRWLVVGVHANGVVSALTQADRNALANGFMLNKNYYLLSEKALEKHIFDDSTSNSNEYATSEIRTYLTGSTFTTKYSFTEEDLNKIDARSLKEMYETDTVKITYDDEDNEVQGTTSLTLPTGYESAEDKFWLLSQTEIQAIFAEDTILCPNDNYQVFYSGRTSAQGTYEAANCWLRSPNTSAYNAYYVSDAGVVNISSVNYSNGVRAALKI
ncbi:MAG: hypothetical protein IJ318_03485 [Clostridia bacterium]|nr:hypothetical protein [Clostridia bacterium]